MKKSDSLCLTPRELRVNTSRSRRLVGLRSLIFPTGSDTFTALFPRKSRQQNCSAFPEEQRQDQLLEEDTADDSAAPPLSEFSWIRLPSNFLSKPRCLAQTETTPSRLLLSGGAGLCGRGTGHEVTHKGLTQLLYVRERLERYDSKPSNMLIYLLGRRKYFQGSILHMPMWIE